MAISGRPALCPKLSKKSSKLRGLSGRMSSLVVTPRGRRRVTVIGTSAQGTDSGQVHREVVRTLLPDALLRWDA